MTTFVGNLVPSGEYTNEPTNPDFGTLAEPDYLLIWLGSTFVGGTHADHQPIAEPADPQVGNEMWSFGFLHWYNHLHVEPLRIDLGNLISVQQRAIAVFNGYFVARVLNDVVPANDTGLTLTEPAATPFAMTPLEELTYLLSISVEGPAIVDASYTFDFDVIDFVVEVTGVRIVAWSWEPNWINSVIERLAWKTDVIPAFDGSEQRRALLAGPRCEWEFTFDVQTAQRRLFENVVYGWGALIWALPIWIDVEPLVDVLVGGSSFIPIADTEGRDFHEEGIGVVLGTDGTFESFEVLLVDPDGIHLVNPIVSTWPTGSRVYPARTARLLDPRSTARFTRNYARGLARFKTVEEIERTALDEELYRGLPVMVREPNWREAPEIDYKRKLATLDFGYGQDDQVDEAGIPLPAQTVRWTMLDRTEANYFRQWIYARQGRFKAVWIPTWSDDLVLADLITASQLNMDVQACGLTYFAKGDVHRRDIRIQLIDGTVFYRRVEGFVVVDTATERMTMNAVLGQQVLPEQVERISWLYCARLDSDQIELSWATPAIAEAMLIFKGPRNEF